MSPQADLAALAAYMPIDRRHGLVAGTELPERTTGTTLFADVSGFTALTGALMKELGPKRGAEEVLVYLNPVFDGLIDELHRYGGVVISFAGDSVTCWLDGDDGRRAIACGLAMQDVMRPYHSMETAGGTPFSLHIKVAVAAGPVRRFAVGSPQIQRIDVLAGDTLQRMAKAEGLAEPGDTVVEAAILDGLGDLVQVTGWREEGGMRVGLVTGLSGAVEDAPWPPLAIDALGEEQVRSWLLPPVHARIKAGQGYLAELRPAVALFMRFTGLDFDGDDEVGAKMDAFITWAQEVVSRYDGYLIQLTVGDKGSFLYTAFGAPIAHDDNAARAVAAALDLRAKATSFEGIDQVQIGISAGRMWTGAYGGINRRTYGVMGNETNMAARLMGKAKPGQIMVSEQVVKAAEHLYHFLDLGTIQVKGRVEPLAVWEASGRKQSASGEWSLFGEPVVGRQEALGALNAALQQVLAGEGRVVRLVGRAGMGKSHVASQFCGDAVNRGMRLAVGACQSITQASPYHPWRQVLRALLDLEDVPDDQALDRLTALGSEAYPQWALRLPLLGDLLELPIPDNPTTAALDAATRQKTLFSLVVEMVQAWAQQQPLLLVIENAHWMDEASLALAQTLARQAVGTAKVLLLLVHRLGQTGGGEILSALAGLPDAVAVELGEMPEGEVAALIERRLGAPPAPLLLSIIRPMARGNPFFVGELLDAMGRSDQLVQEADGRWQVAAPIVSTLRAAEYLVEVKDDWDLKSSADLSAVNIGVPDSIHGIVLSRLDRFSEEQKLTLKVSSVIGHYFDLFLLAQAHPQEKDLERLRAEAEAMEVEEVVYEEEPERTTYSFRHHTTQEVAYETLLFTQRRALHRSVAQSLVELEAGAVIEIAHHAYLGEAWSLALPYNLQAGERAQQLYANQQAIQFYRRALESAHALPEQDTTEERKRISLALGELLVSTGQYEGAVEHLDAAIGLAQAQGDRESEARACRWYGRSHELRGEYPAALGWLDRGLAVLDGQPSSEEAEISLIAGLINIRQGDYERTLALCRRSLQVADRLRDRSVRARTYNEMGIVDRRRGDAHSAVNRFRLSLAQYEELENVYGQATSHNLIANGLYMQGRWTESDGHYRRSLALFQQMGDLYNQVLVSNNLGGIAVKQGRLDAALGYYERAVRLLEQTGGSLWVFGALHMNTANTLIQCREPEAATGRLLMAEELFQRAQLRDLLPELYGLFAEASLLRGQLEEAGEHGQRAVGLARELRMPREQGHNLRILGEIVGATGDHEQAARHLEESYGISVEAGDEYESAKAQLSLAKLYTAQAQAGSALAALERCRPVFERLGAELDLQRANELRRSLNRGETQ